MFIFQSLTVSSFEGLYGALRGRVGGFRKSEIHHGALPCRSRSRGSCVTIRTHSRRDIVKILFILQILICRDVCNSTDGRGRRLDDPKRRFSKNNISVNCTKILINFQFFIFNFPLPRRVVEAPTPTESFILSPR